KNFATRVAEIRQALAPGAPVEVWFQNEMCVGQENKLTDRWAGKGSRPRAVHDQRTQSTYLFGAVCPERDIAAALVLPACNTEAMQSISTRSRPRSPPRLTAFSSSIKPAGMAPQLSGYPTLLGHGNMFSSHCAENEESLG